MPTLSRQNKAKLAALLFWLALIAGYYAIIRRNNLTMEDSIHHLANWLTGSMWGPLFFIALYVVGPLLFFPATILSLLGGFVFGPVGILYTVVGSNASAMMAYSIGRYFGHGVLDHTDKTGVIQRYTQRIRENSFETVLIMHLIFLPYELVNYTCGFLQIGWKPFLAGTAFGSIIATISIVTLGASFGSVEQLVEGEIHLNPEMLITSVLLIGLSITLSRYIKKREFQNDPSI
jgi:uncharacterized membrane protein YdjX (TVP38/TMEM64 family)